MITPTALMALHDTWDHAEAQLPDAVPEAAIRLWLTAHALVNGRIPLEQAAYLHAEANLAGRQHTPEELCVAYDLSRMALLEIYRPRLLNHLWRALHGWGCYDPTPEARAANRKAKIDQPWRESILARLLRTLTMGR